MKRELKKLIHLREKIRELRSIERFLTDKIAATCDHSMTEPFDWEHDTGYGVQTKCTGTRCTICGAKKYYSVWSRS